jgi:hypothetical protein
MTRIGKDDVLMVISDHGFSSFRRGINLNAWLHREGYLALKPGATGGGEWLRHVDWTATKAYCVGLTGCFSTWPAASNRASSRRAPLRRRSRRKSSRNSAGCAILSGREVGIREAFDTTTLYRGPYRDNAPDILIGYNAGYRVSWDCAARHRLGAGVQDNTRAWSGDHCIDPRLVPGVFYCNRHTATEDPALIDIAPTALRLLESSRRRIWTDGRQMGLP